MQIIFFIKYLKRTEGKKKKKRGEGRRDEKEKQELVEFEMG